MNAEINANSNSTDDSKVNGDDNTEIDTDNSNNMPHFTMKQLQAYIYYVKTRFQPELTEFASELLQRYYTFQRERDTSNSTRTTIRLLESLIRLTLAHAKLMCRNKAYCLDACVAISIIEASVQTTGILHGIGKGKNKTVSNQLQPYVFDAHGNGGSIVRSALQYDFPVDSDVEYMNEREAILNALQFNGVPTEEEEWRNGNESGIDQFYQHLYNPTAKQNNTNITDIGTTLPPFEVSVSPSNDIITSQNSVVIEERKTENTTHTITDRIDLTSDIDSQNNIHNAATHNHTHNHNGYGACSMSMNHRNQSNNRFIEVEQEQDFDVLLANIPIQYTKPINSTNTNHDMNINASINHLNIPTAVAVENSVSLFPTQNDPLNDIDCLDI